MSTSFASKIGATETIAVPPQIAVLAESKLDNFQLIPKILPNRYPPPKQVERVNANTIPDILPTSKIIDIFKLAPNKIIASFNNFFEENAIPYLFWVATFPLPFL